MRVEVGVFDYGDENSKYKSQQIIRKYISMDTGQDLYRYLMMTYTNCGLSFVLRVISLNEISLGYNRARRSLRLKCPLHLSLLILSIESN